MYRITRGQLLVVFAMTALALFKGAAFLRATRFSEYGSDPYTSYQVVHFHTIGFVLVFILPLLVIFYSLGWRNFHKVSIFTNKDLKS